MSSVNGNRWKYLTVATAVLLCIGLIYSWSLFARYFSELFPEWSATQLSLTFSISMSFFCIGGLIAGILNGRLSVQVIMRCSAVLIIIGFFGTSLSLVKESGQALIWLYVSYGVLASCGVGACYNVLITTVGRWFTDKSGIATGIMMMGFGSGALILGSLAVRLIEVFQLGTTFRIFGIGMALVIAVGSLLVRLPAPSESVTPEHQKQISSSDKRPADVIKDKAFWIFFLWEVLLSTGGMMVIGNAASIAAAAGLSAVLGLVVSICNGFGRVIFGSIFDKFGRRGVMKANMTILIIAAAILASETYIISPLLVIAGLMMAGMQYGSNPVISSAFVRSNYGSKYYSGNFGLVNFVAIPASVIGPTLASVIITVSGGSYKGAYLFMLFCGIAGALIYIILERHLLTRRI